MRRRAAKGRSRKVASSETKARTRLGWKPAVNFRELVRMMTSNDLELARREAEREAAEIEASR